MATESICFLLYLESVQAPSSLITLGWSRSLMRLYSVTRSERSEGEEEQGRSILTATCGHCCHYHHHSHYDLDIALEAANVEGGGRYHATKLSLAQQLSKLEIQAWILKLLVDLKQGFEIPECYIT